MDNQQQNASEEWRVYKENDTYEVSNLGSIRFTKTKKPKYVGINAQGYYYTQYKVAGKVILKKLHRMIAETFLEPPSKELVEKCSNEHWGKVLVKHLDNNKLNNNVTNLAWCDLKDNTQQAWDDGLIEGLAGSKNGRATLTEDVVELMCADFEKGMMPLEAVRKYKVSHQQATKIRAGIQWKHVWCKYNIKVNRRGGCSTTRA